MNSEFVKKNAEAFSKRLTGDNAQRVRQAIKVAYGREAGQEEVDAALQYLTMFSGGDDISETAWISFFRFMLLYT